VDERFLVALIKAVVVIFVVVTAFAYTLLWERKLIGRFQARYGPNRAGPLGYLQPLADVVKLIFKEDFVPQGANKLLFQIAPMISVFAAVAAIAVIPWGDDFEVFGYTVTGVGTDLNIGVLFLFALSGLGFYGLILGGWASGNKYSLLGGFRSAGQLLAYELPFVLAAASVAMAAGTLSLSGIVEAWEPWWLVWQLPGLFVFFVAGLAELHRPPFDMPVADAEIIFGPYTEYTGIRFALFLLAEYAGIVVLAALTTVLFLGGWQGPFSDALGWLWTLAKVFAVAFVVIWVRVAYPRLRADQLQRLGWQLLVPLALLQLALTGVVAVVRS
jgi:NADH-quinone oxidoreductase subunit H